MSNNIFQSLKQHLRYASIKGELTTEQLFELPLQSKSGFDLDSVARGINTELKAAGEESFVTAANPARTALALKLDVVKEIIADRQADNEAKAAASANAERRELLKGILAEKQNEALKALTPEQIAEELKKLG